MTILSACDLDSGLTIITEFVRKQVALADAFVSNTNRCMDWLELSTKSPKSLSAVGHQWSVSVHGLGVCFTNLDTREMVDVHEGLLEAPEAFDAWRLETYTESRCDISVKSWDKLLTRLCAVGRIEALNTLSGHYKLATLT